MVIVAASLAVAAALVAMLFQPSAAVTRMSALGLMINLRYQGMCSDVWRSPVFLDSLIW